MKHLLILLSILVSIPAFSQLTDTIPFNDIGTDTNEISLEYGNKNTKNLNITLGDEIGNWSYTVIGDFMKTNGYLEHSKKKDNILEGSVGYTFYPGHTIEFTTINDWRRGNLNFLGSTEGRHNMNDPEDKYKKNLTSERLSYLGWFGTNKLTGEFYYGYSKDSYSFFSPIYNLTQNKYGGSIGLENYLVNYIFKTKIEANETKKTYYSEPWNSAELKISEEATFNYSEYSLSLLCQYLGINWYGKHKWGIFNAGLKATYEFDFDSDIYLKWYNENKIPEILMFLGDYNTSYEQTLTLGYEYYRENFGIDINASYKNLEDDPILTGELNNKGLTSYVRGDGYKYSLNLNMSYNPIENLETELTCSVGGNKVKDLKRYPYCPVFNGKFGISYKWRSLYASLSLKYRSNVYADLYNKIDLGDFLSFDGTLGVLLAKGINLEFSAYNITGRNNWIGGSYYKENYYRLAGEPLYMMLKLKINLWDL
jgi:hypothetical protein